MCIRDRTITVNEMKSNQINAKQSLWNPKSVCNKTYISLIEPVTELCDYHFYYFFMSYNSILFCQKLTLAESWPLRLGSVSKSNFRQILQHSAEKKITSSVIIQKLLLLWFIVYFLIKLALLKISIKIKNLYLLN